MPNVSGEPPRSRTVTVCTDRFAGRRNKFGLIQQKTRLLRPVAVIETRFLRAAVAVVTVTFVLIGFAYPQTGRGPYSIRGKLIDPSDSAVPRAPVVLKGPGGEQVLETAIDGGFQFIGLTPGRYRLQTTVPGFVSVDREVEVRKRLVTRLVVRLTLAAIKEEISVSGRTNQLTSDIADNRNAISVERGLLETLPILNLDFLTALSRFLDPSNPG